MIARSMWPRMQPRRIAIAMALALAWLAAMLPAMGCNLSQPMPVAEQMAEQRFAEPGPLRVGAGKIDLTPDLTAAPAKLVGYGFGRMATAIHRPLFARAVVIEAGTTRVAVVSLEQLIVPSHMARAIEQRVADLNFATIWIHATHSHSAEGGYWNMPMAEGYMMGPYREAIERRRVTAAEMAVRVAFARLRSAAMEYASVSTVEKTFDPATGERADVTTLAGPPSGLEPGANAAPTTTRALPALNKNRRLGNEGRCDDRLGRLVFREATSGMVIAQLLFFSAHATVLSREDTQVSGDWPGELAALAEDAVPGSVAAVFTTAIGDAGPVPPTATGGGKPLSTPDQATAMARQLLARLPLLPGPPLRVDRPDDGVRVDVVTLRDPLPLVDVPLVPNWVFFAEYPLAMLFDSGWMPDIAELKLLRLGPVVLAGWPSEPGMAHQLELRMRARGFGFADAWLVANVSGWMGYTLDAKSYAAKSGYEETFTMYGTERGDRWLRMTGDALGRLPRKK